MLEREACLHIDPDFLSCVGFIGSPTAHGFAADGTCFMLAIEEDGERFTYLVTARHLVRPIKFRKEIYPEGDLIHVRLPRRDHLPAHVMRMTRGQWTPHIDNRVDVCVAEIDPRMRWSRSFGQLPGRIS